MRGGGQLGGVGVRREDAAERGEGWRGEDNCYVRCVEETWYRKRNYSTGGEVTKEGKRCRTSEKRLKRLRKK